MCENKEEEQYLNMTRRVIEDGSLEEGRNGNTICLYGEKMEFSLDDNVLPLLTSKKVAWRMFARASLVYKW